MSTLPPHPDLPGELPTERARFAQLAVASHAVISQHQHAGGAYPATTVFSAYAGYAWLRDGAFTAEGMSRYGDVESADRFHDWVDSVLAARRQQVDDLISRAATGDEPGSTEMLPTRFALDGSDGPDDWWDFQTDGYGAWLWAVVEHARRHGSDLERWRAGIDVAVDYLLGFWDRPCYDWWEMHLENRHVSTLAAIYGGLASVSRAGVLAPTRGIAVRATCLAIRGLVLSEGVADGHLVKWLGSTAVDGSLASAIVPFGMFDPSAHLARATMGAVRTDLDHDGGVHRFLGDVFYGGGQWLLLSALVGWNLSASGDMEGAMAHLRWIAAHADDDQFLAEQVPDHLLHPGHRQEWIDRWGPVATPLLWSHGMYLILADELGLIPGEM